MQRNVRTGNLLRNPHLIPAGAVAKKILDQENKAPSSIFDLHFAQLITSKSVMHLKGGVLDWRERTDA